MKEHADARALEAVLERSPLWNHYDYFVTAGCESSSHTLKASACTIQIDRVIYG
jgi:hypothetical protein